MLPTQPATVGYGNAFREIETDRQINQRRRTLVITSVDNLFKRFVYLSVCYHVFISMFNLIRFDLFCFVFFRFDFKRVCFSFSRSCAKCWIAFRPFWMWNRYAATVSLAIEKKWYACFGFRDTIEVKTSKNLGKQANLLSIKKVFQKKLFLNWKRMVR